MSIRQIERESEMNERSEESHLCDEKGVRK
jgi:hypothetical protein